MLPIENNFKGELPVSHCILVTETFICRKMNPVMWNVKCIHKIYVKYHNTMDHRRLRVFYNVLLLELHVNMHRILFTFSVFKGENVHFIVRSLYY
jgi:hypothetical protein